MCPTRLFLLAVLLSPCLFLPSPGSPQENPKPAPIPKGEVTKYTFNQSKIFPGTVREYWVYVPKQYDPAKPACVYVNQDGIQFNAPAVFDELIHKKEMPVTIGIFIRPGVVPATSPQALARYNRSYEYDGLGDNYARFLLEELLPEVEKKTTADGRPIKLSKDGNDRCIGGSSSGAICAFTAAWERPDAFRRVFSSIGTYVGLRGGNIYPTLIRKTEPKPIRIFLQDGSNDLNIYGGDWWTANQEMERALTFAGYEVNHAWGTGGHNGNDATKLFPDAMRWLWKDWPNPVKAGAGSPQLREILVPGEEWQQVTDKYKAVGGLTANAKGEVFFEGESADQSSKLYALGLDGKVRVVRKKMVRADGQAFGPDGRLFSVSMSARQLLAIDARGEGKVLLSDLPVHRLIVRHDGGIYMTQFGEVTLGSKLWYISPKGEKRELESELPGLATAVTVSPDQSLLYLGDGMSRWITSFQIQPDGSLTHKQQFYHLHLPDADSSCTTSDLHVDREGRLYAATAIGLQICDQAGRVNCIIPGPGAEIRTFCFGGPNFDTLYATCDGTIYKRKVKVQGANAFEPPIKPKPPRL